MSYYVISYIIFKNVGHLEFVMSSVWSEKDFMELGLERKYCSIPFICYITHYINISCKYHRILQLHRSLTFKPIILIIALLK